MSLKNIFSKFKFFPDIILLRIFLKTLLIYHKIILNTYIDARECIKGAIYLEAFKQYPNKKFYEIESLVNNIVKVLLFGDDKELSDEEKYLLNVACDDGTLLRLISDSHHLSAFSIYIWIAIDNDREIEYREKLEAAQSFDSNSETITRANFTSYQKKYKRLHKKLKKKVKAHQKDQIKIEVFDDIPMLNIGLTAIISITTLISLLLYIGGYLYSKILFDLLGTDHAIYFGPMDYFVTGLSTTTSVLAMVAISSIFILLVVYDLKTVKRAEYHYDQISQDENDIAGEFLIEKDVTRSALSSASSIKKSSSEKVIRQWDIYFGLGVIFLMVLSFYNAYVSDSGVFEAVKFPLMMLITMGVAWSGVLRVFPQPLLALFVLVLITNFIFSVISHGIKDANSILAGECINDSKLAVKQKRSGGDDTCLIKASDSWVVLFDNQSKSTIAYPREEVSFIE